MKIGDKFKTDHKISYIIFGDDVPRTKEVSNQVYGSVIKIDQNKKEVYLQDPRDPDYTYIVSFNDFETKNKFQNKSESKLSLRSIYNSIIKESSSNQEMQEMAINFLDTMGGSIEDYPNGIRGNPRYVRYFKELGVNSQIAQKIYDLAKGMNN